MTRSTHADRIVIIKGGTLNIFLSKRGFPLRFLLKKPPRNQHDQISAKHDQLNPIMTTAGDKTSGSRVGGPELCV